MIAHSIDPVLRSVEALADLLRAVAWPTVVLVVFFMLREPLRSKFQDLLSLRGGGVEATFQVQPQSTEEIAREVEEPAKALLSDSSESPADRRREISALVERAVQLGFAAAGGIGPADVKTSWVSGEPDIKVFAERKPKSDGGRWEIYRDHSGKYRWRLKAATGEVMAVGEAYETQAAAVSAIEAVRRAAGGSTHRI